MLLWVKSILNPAVMQSMVICFLYSCINTLFLAVLSRLLSVRRMSQAWTHKARNKAAGQKKTRRRTWVEREMNRQEILNPDPDTSREESSPSIHSSHTHKPHTQMYSDGKTVQSVGIRKIPESLTAGEERLRLFHYPVGKPSRLSSSL